MRRTFSVIVLFSGAAFASGTVDRLTDMGGRCATSSIEGVISSVDLKLNSLSVAGHSFKVSVDTSFRIPGATRQEMQDAPLSKVPKDAKAKVLYCSKDGRAVEVKVER